MSGIAAIYYLDGRTVGDELGRMVEAMEHRGPDGIYTWQEGPVGMGHCKLHTTPESLYDEQPLVDQSGDIVLTADARIDNRRELISSLNLEARKRSEIPDSRIILSSYKRWGEKCVNHLVGAFAFAIWDFRKEEMFCARDHMGIKPMYYSKNKNYFTICTQISPILKHVSKNFKLDKEHIKSRVKYGKTEKNSTCFKSVKRVCKASKVKLKAGEFRKEEYWELSINKKSYKMSKKEYIDEFRRRLTEAVRCRLRSAGSVATELSGGLDSSAVTSIAWNQIKNKDALKSFSLYFDEIRETDEREYIYEVLKGKEIEPVFLSGEKKGPFSYISLHSEKIDDFITFGNFFFSLALYEKVGNSNTSVVLDGFDGDTTVSHGISYLKDLSYEGKTKNLIRNFTSLENEKKEVCPDNLFDFLCPVFEKKAQEGRWLSIIRDMIFTSQVSSAPTSREIRFLAGMARRESRIFVCNLLGWSNGGMESESCPDQMSYSQKEHLEGLESRWLVYSLEWINSAAAAFGLEIRHPFMDKRLVELCLNTPSSLKLRRGVDRWIMRAALQDILPDSVCWRTTKANFQPAVQWIMRSVEREEFASALEGGFEDVDEYLPFRAEEAVRAHERIAESEAHPEDYSMVWSTVYLRHWLKDKGK